VNRFRGIVLVAGATGRTGKWIVMRLQDGTPFRHQLQFGTGDKLMGVIDRSDVAECAVVSLWHPKARNMTFELIRGAEVPQTSLETYFDRLS
jgi:hypothetical protein